MTLPQPASELGTNSWVPSLTWRGIDIFEIARNRRSHLICPLTICPAVIPGPCYSTARFRYAMSLEQGLNLSGHNPEEIKLAELDCGRFPSIDKVRFTNSDTEKNLLAISSACYLTKRK